jgi:hypothetical protein
MTVPTILIRQPKPTMLTKITRALNWADEKLENLLADLAANYARELLAAHGLVEIEIDHIRRNLKVEPAVPPIESDRVSRVIPSNQTLAPQTRLRVIQADRATHPTEQGQSLKPPTSKCDLWSGPEVVAALCVAGAAIAGLLFCLAPDLLARSLCLRPPAGRDHRPFQ